MPNDSGNYSCSPSNAESAHIAVHIHSTGNPAASIQHGKRSARYLINGLLEQTNTILLNFDLTINVTLVVP